MRTEEINVCSLFVNSLVACYLHHWECSCPKKTELPQLTFNLGPCLPCCEMHNVRSFQMQSLIKCRCIDASVIEDIILWCRIQRQRQRQQELGGFENTFIIWGVTWLKDLKKLSPLFDILCSGSIVWDNWGYLFGQQGISHCTLLEVQIQTDNNTQRLDDTSGPVVSQMDLYFFSHLTHKFTFLNITCFTYLYSVAWRALFTGCNTWRSTGVTKTNNLLNLLSCL